MQTLKETVFQSTLPARGATGVVQGVPQDAFDFNPRSLHGERHERSEEQRRVTYFNPRSLHGERLAGADVADQVKQISIHAPCTGSDIPVREEVAKQVISIHAPCTGSDASPS